MGTSVLRPSGTGFQWCINPFDGCAHGCRYCYGMVIRRKTYSDWLCAEPRKKVIEKLEKDIDTLQAQNAQIKDIFVGSITDSYQPLEREFKLTRQVVQLLKEYDLPFTILTKSDLVLRDVDLFRNYKWCRVGVTITSLDEGFRKNLEPYSASYEKRIEVLKSLKANKIPTYVSCEPIFPVKEAKPVQIIRELKDVVDLFEFGRWNKYRTQGIPGYYYANYSDDYYVKIFEKIIKFCENEKINYCLASHSKEFIEQHHLPFKPYPSVKP